MSTKNFINGVKRELNRQGEIQLACNREQMEALAEAVNLNNTNFRAEEIESNLYYIYIERGGGFYGCDE